MNIEIDNKIIYIKNANTFFKKTIGLMGKKNITYGMYFKNVNAIHTFGMKDSIDILFLNDENIVLDKKINMKKNNIFICKQKKANALELPKNICLNINIGDKLTFESK